jgi:hypothetical protein
VKKGVMLRRTGERQVPDKRIAIAGSFVADLAFRSKSAPALVLIARACRAS